MNKQKWIVFVAALTLMACAAALLVRFKAGQRLGQPGVKTSPIAGVNNLRVELPENIPGYKSEVVETPSLVTSILPKDTSFGQRRYQADDDFQAVISVVLMGTDRTSLHKPQFCVVGAGWTIDQTEVTAVQVERPVQYELPVIKLTTTKQVVIDGRPVTARGIYVYWFVADNEISSDPSGFNRMLSLGKHLLRTGELQRWAYITYFAVCPPGGEEATYDRMKQLMRASVPEFQLVPQPATRTEVSSVSAEK